MSKLTTCKSCGKEVAKSASKCPHCGEKLKMGLFMKLLIAAVVIGVVSAVMAPGKEDKLKLLKEMAAAQPAAIDPHGELADIFTLGSKYTDLQRESKEKELKNKIVDWTLPVFEVKLINKDSKIYKVQTSSQGHNVGTFVRIQALDEGDENLLANLKTGDMIHFKGKITGTSIRNLDIDPAVLVRNNPAFVDSAAPPAAAEQKPAATAPAKEAAAESATPATEPPKEAPKPAVTEAPSSSVPAPAAVASQKVTASFDCAKAASVQEKLICSSPALGEADVKLNAAYKAAAQKSTDPAELKKDQLAWMKSVRNACNDEQCLMDAMSKRTLALAN